MAQDLERIQSRLDNIRSVGPILSALRTISLGSWQMALNRVRGLEEYSARLLELLPVLLPHIKRRHAGITELRRVVHWVTPVKRESAGNPARVITVVIGSERGLCGRYNAVVLEHLSHYLTAHQDDEVALVALGARVIRGLERQASVVSETYSLPVTRLPAFTLAYRLMRDWLEKYETDAIDAVDVVFNAYEGAGRYSPAALRLLPPVLPESIDLWVGGNAVQSPVIVETDPLRLYTRVIEQWTTTHFYSVLLGAAASEHSARYHLMESATQNADRLIEELAQELQSARRQTITREMQELAAGAGMLGT